MKINEIKAKIIGKSIRLSNCDEEVIHKISDVTECNNYYYISYSFGIIHIEKSEIDDFIQGNDIYYHNLTNTFIINLMKNSLVKDDFLEKARSALIGMRLRSEVLECDAEILNISYVKDEEVYKFDLAGIDFEIFLSEKDLKELIESRYFFEEDNFGYFIDYEILSKDDSRAIEFNNITSYDED